jgi:hypothetical protein
MKKEDKSYSAASFSLPSRRRRDVLGVVPERRSREARVKHLDGVHDEPGPDLGECAVLLQDLKVAEPDLVVDHAEREDVVEEGLRLRVLVGNGKDLEGKG